MKKLNFEKTTVSKYINVDLNVPKEGNPHRVWVIMRIVCNDKSKEERYFRIGRTATDDNVNKIKAEIAKKIVDSSTLEQIQEMYKIDESIIEGVVFVDKTTFIPYEEKG